MIKINLSFKLGKIIWEDQSTFEKVWEHPVLDIGNSYSALKVEVKDWLNEQCNGAWEFGFNNSTYEMRFKSERDALLFKLRWM